MRPFRLVITLPDRAFCWVVEALTLSEAFYVAYRRLDPWDRKDAVIAEAH